MQIKKSGFHFTRINLNSSEKEKVYKQSQRQIDSVLQGETNTIAKMATINCILRENIPYYFWTGFYLVHNGELVVGPYQGTLGCLHIPFQKGVCGAAARSKTTQIVPDVHLFPGHIACDSKSQSEIVVPVFDKENKLIAVFDVDSTEKSSFDEIDRIYLEKILHQHFCSIEQIDILLDKYQL